MTRRLGVALVVILLGAAGVTAVVTRGGASGRSVEPSVKSFDLGPAARRLPDPPSAPVTFTEPATPTAALELFLTAESQGNSALSYALLPPAERAARFPVLASWANDAAARPRPIRFAVRTGPPSSAAGPTELVVDVERAPLIDAFSGFVAARSTEAWRVRRVNGAWKVDPEPLRSAPVLPDDRGALPAAARWVERTTACDRAGAVALQVAKNLYGPAPLAAGPCAGRGAWKATRVLPFSDAPEATTYVAAFGSGIEQWARLVEVRGGDRQFLAVLAPLGDQWRVLGVMSDGAAEARR